MATEKIRVGIIGANMRNGWARDAHIPALSALPEFEITAVSTSRQETADETARHFEIPHSFADPYKMVQHPDVDLVSICVRVPFHHQLGMAALNAGKHLYCEWPLAATTEQAHQMRDLAVRKGSTIWWGYKPAAPPRSIASETWSPRATLARCFPAR
jgi:predicted dehydrogenase